ncbi:MAG: hypothetical protein ACJAWA_000507 [Nonlabens sp.]|jgi:hypothetical protein
MAFENRIGVGLTLNYYIDKKEEFHINLIG